MANIRKDILETLPQELRHMIFSQVLHWDGISSPNFLKAVRCNKHLYKQVLTLFCQMNTLRWNEAKTWSEEVILRRVDHLRDMSVTARRYIQNLDINCPMYSKENTSAKLASCFDENSQLQNLTLHFRALEIKRGRGIHHWLRLFLTRTRFLKCIQIVCPAVLFSSAFTRRAAIKDSAWTFHLTINLDHLTLEMVVKLVDMCTGVKGVQKRMRKSDTAALEIPGDLRKELRRWERPSCYRVWQWTAERGECLEWDEDKGPGPETDDWEEMDEEVEVKGNTDDVWELVL